MPLINCPQCGNQVSDRATFCMHCGVPISSQSMQGPVNQMPPAQPQPAPSVYQQQRPVSPHAMLPQEQDHSWLLFIWIIMVILDTGTKNLFPAISNEWTTNKLCILLYWGFSIICNMLMMLIPLNIKNQAMKIIGFILIGGFGLYLLYGNGRMLIEGMSQGYVFAGTW